MSFVRHDTERHLAIQHVESEIQQILNAAADGGYFEGHLAIQKGESLLGCKQRLNDRAWALLNDQYGPQGNYIVDHYISLRMVPYFSVILRKGAPEHGGE